MVTDNRGCPRSTDDLAAGVEALLPTRRTVLRAAGSLGLVGAVGTHAGSLLSPVRSSPSDEGDAVINTYKVFDGHRVVAPFGYPDTTTYGQTVTVPAGWSAITKVTFYMTGLAGVSQQIVVRGEIYGWNGVHATTSIAESEKQKLAFDNPDFNEVKLKFTNAIVEPGEQYVVFASIDPDYKEADGDYTVSWGAVDGGSYTGGGLVFQNNSGKESDWTSTAWTPVPNYDAAVKVFMSA